LSAAYKGYTLWELPPSNQGIAALEMLRILAPFDVKAMGHNSPAYLHHLIEAKKLAYADLDQYVGDADHLTLSPERLLGDPFISARRAKLDPQKASAVVQPGDARTSSETIYLTVADSAGNMVSFINSLFDEFGSGIVVPGTGFALHDRGAGFTVEAGFPNTVAPGKRPFHTLIPAFVTRTDADGRQAPWMSFGVMGGAMQAQGHVQLLLNMVEFGMDVQQAIDAPRFRHLNGLRVHLEAAIPDSVRSALRAMGHEITSTERGAFGGAQAIVRLARGYIAGSDPRKDGLAVGH
jgi:gamma-glutamyltranspeptidase/glutathione hydrolase